MLCRIPVGTLGIVCALAIIGKGIHKKDVILSNSLPL